ncbi:Serpin B9 [Hypsibius exemplaris]|uniref:Serpin B9 n=1 Tax=Hypsibius exemplaris TaxID=2072580 RepID=A0A1W0WXL1_HYPEX|nr:Serpin B9 [Hypsibius exemplaris]
MGFSCSLTTVVTISLAIGLSYCLETPNKFAVELYKNVAKTSGTDKNVALSPFSAEAALSMTYVGAAGTTKSELASVLGLGDDGVATLARKFKSINAGSQDYVLQSANGIFLEKTYKILSNFRSSVTNDFGANISTVDFVKQAEQSRVRINSFVEEKTNNKIRDLFSAGSLDSDTRLVLVNAVYFKAQWANKFEKDFTKEQPFTLANGQQKQVQLMNLGFDQFVPYAEVAELDGAQVVELRYAGDETSMVVILPRKESGLRALEERLTAATLKSTLAKLSRRKVNVFLPKFKVETDYNLVEELKAMGIKAAFERTANFSLISSQAALKISKVVQKVFVNVDEDGTEAAAATGVIMVLTSAMISPDEPVTFRVDRPFLYLIRHKATNSILFLGKVADPTVAK